LIVILLALGAACSGCSAITGGAGPGTAGDDPFAMPARPTGHQVLRGCGGDGCQQGEADWIREGWVALPEEDYGEQLHYILDLESALQRRGGVR
jgi:hypothetical protein